MKGSLEFTIAMLIRDINSKMNQKIMEELKTTGLTVPQITVIKLIAHHKELTVTELSERMSVTKATMSGILDRLENMDIIERVRSEEDKRMVYVKFSAEGFKMALQIKEIMNNCFKNIFKGIEEERLEGIEKQLISLVGIIEESLDKK
ncbi:MarR family winged helix-turn-helix transcriptional regulator [Hathewaya limosa]|uniref:DNA-binding MarR family transcriptional regulator n=1 Tax=Hathewaya limosa TaxID=1536 RepID=A0ABU0JTY9_HATLI|nr:MarR family transcriptional regulator [Hathewaya limosa]AWZ47538.1 MarR family transcriptional regulator [Clostridiaceae bacterium 14S0207]MDQ0480568.1 DNA-binding MarR family transcriptional regulator [Hathewaya limosa]